MNKQEAFDLGDGLVLCREYFEVPENNIGENFQEWITTYQDLKTNGIKKPTINNSKVKVNITNEDKTTIIEVNKDNNHV